jgi:hypothetical protein
MHAASPRRLPSALRWLALALVALALAALAGEALVRATGALDQGPVPRRLLEATGAAEPPYRLRAGVRLAVLGRDVRVSSLGLRGPEIAPRPPSGSRRVLVLGDSVAFGWGLDEAESFPAQLEGQLRARGVAAEVLNAGVPGYSTASEAALHRELAPELAPDAVVLAVSLNDFTPTPSLSPLGFPQGAGAQPTPGWLARSELYALLRWRIGLLRAPVAAGEDPEYGARLALFLRRAAIASRERFYAEAGGPGWEPIERGLSELSADAGPRLLVAIFPEEDQIEAAGERLPQRRWAERCEALGLRCLDLAPAFLRAAGAGPLFADLQHPNGRGNAVAAEATAELLAPSLPAPDGSASKREKRARSERQASKAHRASGARSEPQASKAHRASGARSEPQASEAHRASGARSEPQASEAHRAGSSPRARASRSSSARSARSRSARDGSFARSRVSPGSAARSKSCVHSGWPG